MVPQQFGLVQRAILACQRVVFVVISFVCWLVLEITVVYSVSSVCRRCLQISELMDVDEASWLPPECLATVHRSGTCLGPSTEVLSLATRTKRRECATSATAAALWHEALPPDSCSCLYTSDTSRRGRATASSLQGSKLSCWKKPWRPVESVESRAGSEPRLTAPLLIWA